MASHYQSSNIIPLLFDIINKTVHKNTDDEYKFNIITLALNAYDIINKDTDNINLTHMIKDLNAIKNEFDNQKNNNTSISICINQVYAIFLYSNVDY